MEEIEFNKLIDGILWRRKKMENLSAAIDELRATVLSDAPVVLSYKALQNHRQKVAEARQKQCELYACAEEIHEEISALVSKITGVVPERVFYKNLAQGWAVYWEYRPLYEQSEVLIHIIDNDGEVTQSYAEYVDATPTN